MPHYCSGLNLTWPRKSRQRKKKIEPLARKADVRTQQIFSTEGSKSRGAEVSSVGQTFSCNFLFLISWRMSECIQISFAMCRVGIYTVSSVCFCSSKCHENINEVLASTWSNGNVLCCWWECRFVQPLWKEIKLSASILSDAGKSTPRYIYLREIV